MSLERLRQAAEKIRRERAEIEQQRRQHEEQLQADEMFRISWGHVFDARDSYPSDDFTRRTTAAFLSLADGIRERFLDFRLIAFLLTPNREPAFIFAAELLLYASMGDSEMVAAYLTAGPEVFQPMVTAHFEFIHFLPTFPQEQLGLPFTPPITLAELANLLDLSYATIWGEKRISGPRRKWETLDDEPGKQRKRWRSTDPERQQRLLNACRGFRSLLVRSWSESQ